VPGRALVRRTVAEYCRLYDVTAAAVRGRLPGTWLGGPATTGNGHEFLDRFLEHCVRQGTPLDFLSFHTKGAPEFRAAGPMDSVSARWPAPESSPAVVPASTDRRVAGERRASLRDSIVIGTPGPR
jgi:xylan 1,4-beta-xylosidase